ncbi:MAG TPA: serine/threonine-protein kinase, partial [Acidimicrobiia bacterium]
MTPLQAGDPRRLGRWRLVGRLGAGGMGVVYLGRGRRARRVAIKVPRADLARDPAFRERFRREAAAASAVAARCTARVLEVQPDGKRPYIVTEYVEGPTLHAAVTGDGPLSGADLAAFAVGVAEAMAAMHAAGVTHRDLTPGNVILGRWGPRVIDFGIAHADDASTLTQTGMRVGTPAWMAPEQARGERVTSAADTFSWGTLVAYAGTGRHPFGAGRADAVIYRIVHEPPDLEGLEPALAPLVERALDKRPAARPAPGELIDALTALEAAMNAGVAAMATVPVAATRVMTAPPTAPALPPRTGSQPRRVPSTPPLSGRPLRQRRRWLRAAAIAGFVLLLGTALGAGVAVLLDRANGSDPQAAPSGTDPDRTTDSTTTTTAPPRSLAAYCLRADDYYQRLDEFNAQFDSFPLPFPLFPPDDEEYRAALVDFAAENADLFT